MMQTIRNFFHRLFGNCYGVDQLNLVILVVDMILSLVALLVGSTILSLLVYIPMGIVLFRMLSKNKYKRYQENRRFLQMVDRLKDRDNCYYRCPKCHQTVRVPRNKGKISIKCPRCGEKFIKKT